VSPIPSIVKLTDSAIIYSNDGLIIKIEVMKGEI